MQCTVRWGSSSPVVRVQFSETCWPSDQVMEHQSTWAPYPGAKGPLGLVADRAIFIIIFLLYPHSCCFAFVWTSGKLHPVVAIVVGCGQVVWVLNHLYGRPKWTVIVYDCDSSVWYTISLTAACPAVEENQFIYRSRNIKWLWIWRGNSKLLISTGIEGWLSANRKNVVYIIRAQKDST